MTLPAEPAALVAVFTTVATREDAVRLARALVTESLAACVQIERIDSVFRWEGRVHEDVEHRLLVKTTRLRRAAVIKRVRELHPYSLPAIWSHDVSVADPSYAAWVLAGSQPA